jgi:hypothetical protein
VYDTGDHTPDLEFLFVFEFNGFKVRIGWHQPDLAALLFQGLDGKLSIKDTITTLPLTGVSDGLPPEYPVMDPHTRSCYRR